MRADSGSLKGFSRPTGAISKLGEAINRRRGRNVISEGGGGFGMIDAACMDTTICALAMII